jgi:hypothetical protein
MKTVKLGRLRWLEHLTGANEASSRPEGTRRAGRPSLRWLDNVEKDLRILGVRGWEIEALDRKLWRMPRPIQGCSASIEEEEEEEEVTQVIKMGL